MVKFVLLLPRASVDLSSSSVIARCRWQRFSIIQFLSAVLPGPVTPAYSGKKTETVPGRMGEEVQSDGGLFFLLGMNPNPATEKGDRRGARRLPRTFDKENEG
jgi:hypothetical protein